VHIGFGARHGGVEETALERQQRLAGRHPIAWRDEYLGDVTLDARRETRPPRGDERAAGLHLVDDGAALHLIELSAWNRAT
jgi:hypothetical protein